MSQSASRDSAGAHCTPDGGVAEFAMQAADPTVDSVPNRVEPPLPA